MTEPVDTPVPDDARWWLAHEGCGTLVWDGSGGIVLAANTAAVRLLGPPVAAMPNTGLRQPDATRPGAGPGETLIGASVRDLFEIADRSSPADLPAWLGAAYPSERRIPRQGQDDLRLWLITWALPGPQQVWATLCLEADAPSQPDAAFAAHMELLYQRSPLMYFTVDDQGRILGVNHTAIEQLAYSRAELVGRSLADLFHPDDRESAARQIALGFDEPDTIHECELRKVRRDGDVMWVAQWARAVPGLGDAAELLVVWQDVTARRGAEQALRDSEARFLQAQKQEALGRLAGGIAHDFSNLLTVVLGHCDAARQLLPGDSPVLEELQGIREVAQQATNLSRQLLTFSKRQVVQPEPLRLDDVVARMTPLFRRLLGARIALEVVWLPGLPRVLADPGQIEQVLTNLVVNARDAITDDGNVRISTSLAGAAAFTDDTGVAAQPGRTYLCLSIRDDGVGMPEEVRQRAFEPFFTTKADDRGTGLGLPTVHSIVTQAGGGVAVASAPGQGCDVRVYLPTIPTSAAPAAAPAEARTFPGGHETVLLVEDREAVRRVAQRFLARRGYRVLEAESAEEALEVAAAHAGEIDLLLSDVILGGMDGYALAIALTASQPSIRVVLMSGYPSEMLARAGHGGPIFPFVNKPIDFPTLAQLLRDQLERRS